MSWLWLDVVDEPAPDAIASTPVRTPGGNIAGHLAWWAKTTNEHRPGHALRVDERVVGGGGSATWISWCRADPPTMSLPFDDAAVTGALRRRLAQAWPEAVSTLLVDWSRVGGAITTGATVADVYPDPFTLVFDRRVLRVEEGILGPIPAPTGPGVTRYGSGNPWPWDVYSGQTP